MPRLPTSIPPSTLNQPFPASHNDRKLLPRYRHRSDRADVAIIRAIVPTTVRSAAASRYVGRRGDTLAVGAWPGAASQVRFATVHALCQGSLRFVWGRVSRAAHGIRHPRLRRHLSSTRADHRLAGGRTRWRVTLSQFLTIRVRRSRFPFFSLSATGNCDSGTVLAVARQFRVVVQMTGVSNHKGKKQLRPNVSYIPAVPGTRKASRSGG